ncbi:MAG: ABC transporter permease [Clostridia bacterium]|nr:ABC transporter permease [Clostridiales bacterium]MBQ3231760.1 ABC transporter permease [Clostridia bacterium]
MLKFALKNMFVRRARVLLVILSIILSASVALLAFNISQQVNEGIISTAGYYDMIIGPAGSSTQLAMNTMFFTDEPLGTISYEYVEELKASPLTNAVVPFTMGDSFNGARIVGTTPEYLNGKTIKSGEMFSEPFEAVVGSAVAQRYGLTLGSAMVTSHGLTGTGHAHEANPLTVVGILSKTGTAYDNVVFTACETVWAVHDHSEETDAHEEDEHHGEEEHHEESAPETASDAAMGHFLPGSANAPKQDETGNQAQKTQDTEDKHEHHHGDVCAILVKSKSFNDYFKLMEIYGTNASLLCINPSTVLREVLEQVDLSTQIVYVLCAVILLMNIVVISVITLLNMYDAQKEIALMRLIGISMKKIGQLYLIQNGIIGLISTILALILSHACLGLMGSFVASMGIVLNVTNIYALEWGIMALVFVLSILPTMIRILTMSRKDSLSV